MASDAYISQGLFIQASLPSFLPWSSYLPLCRECSSLSLIAKLTLFPQLYDSILTTLCDLIFTLLNSFSCPYLPNCSYNTLFSVEAVCLHNVLRWIACVKSTGIISLTLLPVLSNRTLCDHVKVFSSHCPLC